MDDIRGYLRKKACTDNGAAMDCFEKYDTDRDGFLDMEEFGSFLSDVFQSKDGPYEIDSKTLDTLMKCFDVDKDKRLSPKEFDRCLHLWVKQIVAPVTALVIIDVQNDFIDGTLALKHCQAKQDGAAVVPVINSLLDNIQFDVVVYSKDWHPDDHISFMDNLHLRPLHTNSKVKAKDKVTPGTQAVFEGSPPMEQRLWPRHCVQESWGSELHQDLKVVDGSLVVNKGTNPNIDSYSAFWDNMKFNKTELFDLLSERHVTDVYVCGLAYDICVGFTAKDSVEHGFRTILVDDACRGVCEEDISHMKKDLGSKNVLITESPRVADLATAKDRPVCLGVLAALALSAAEKGGK